MMKAKHVLLAFCIFALLLLLLCPPEFLDSEGYRIIVRKPLPGPKWIWDLFIAIETSAWKQSNQI